MTDRPNFLIIDGYNKASRDSLQASGMRLAWDLYVEMLRREIPEADYDLLLPSDPGVAMPAAADLEKYDGVLWTGCNLCIHDENDASVAGQIQLAKDAFEVGVPSFGSCWGLQIAAVAAGGDCKANPKGREMGMARKIHLTAEGQAHPMMEGRNGVFEAYISHDDEVTELPEGATLMASNDWTRVQALAVRHKNGEFWAVQYHPEYDLHELACLIKAREEKLIKLGFYPDRDALLEHVGRMEALHADPANKSLRWLLAIDDDVLSAPIRTVEFGNWIKKQALPYAASRH